MGKFQSQPCLHQSAAAAWFPLVALGCMIMQQPVQMKRARAVKRTCAKPPAGSGAMSSQARPAGCMHGAERDDSDRLVAAQPPEPEVVIMRVPRPLPSSAADSPPGDGVSGNQMVTQTSEAQSAADATDDSLHPDVFARACSWQLNDFMPWSSLPRCFFLGVFV